MAGADEVEATDTALGIYDPLLTTVQPKARYPHYKYGYKIWPSEEIAAEADFRIMAIGNSTSLWPSAAWSMRLGELLAERGLRVGIYNGAGKGHSSSQEILRVVRDAPAIRPDLIIALSGICDIGNITNSPRFPFFHKYTRQLANHLKEIGYAKIVVSGYLDQSPPAQVWCRNQRLARVLANELGIEYLTLLQPVQGFGAYPQSKEEEEFFATKSPVVLRGSMLPYGEAVTSFYTEVLAEIAKNPAKFDHVRDFTDVFGDCPGAYRDHRHQSDAGVDHLARRIEALVRDIRGL